MFSVWQRMKNFLKWIAKGLSDAKLTYQVKGWTGWHHHMVMTLLAMLFILGSQVEFGKNAPITSVQDVREILEDILPKKKNTEEEILAIILQNIEHASFYQIRSPRPAPGIGRCL